MCPGGCCVGDSQQGRKVEQSPCVGPEALGCPRLVQTSMELLGGEVLRGSLQALCLLGQRWLLLNRFTPRQGC